MAAGRCQYVAVTSGYGGVYSLFSGDERLANVPAGDHCGCSRSNPNRVSRVIKASFGRGGAYLVAAR